MSGDAGPMGGGGSGAGGTGSGNLGPGPDAPVCGMTTFGLDKIPPDLLVVLDKSGSMNQAVGTQQTSKWDDMTAAINQVVGQTETTIRWGLKYFPNDEVCTVTDGTSVPIAAMNAAMIGTSIQATTAAGRTPTRVAVQSGASYLASLAEPNPKYILLATDGQPNCLDPGAGMSTPDEAGSIQAVAAAAAMGIPTFVIGIATTGDVADLTLSQMATAGMRPRTGDPKYYPVSNKDDLVATLTMIGGQIASCTFGLGSRPPDPTNIAVTADGARIMKDSSHSNGWDYGTGQTSIQLFGTWCDKAKAGTIKDVKAIFGCPGVVIP